MKRFLIIILALSLLTGLAGCRDGFSIRNQDTSADDTEKAEETDEIKDSNDTSGETVEETSGETSDQTDATNTEPEVTASITLPELPDEFLFMSGAGGWSTILHIYPDGTFDGYYHDSDMGDTGEDYPNGTMYECAFSGKFTGITQVSEFEYSMTLESIEYEAAVNSERIEEGVKIISTEAYGMDSPDVFLLYLPGRPTADLPADYLDWVGMPNVWSEGEVPEELPFFGLYNVGGAEGFFAG